MTAAVLGTAGGLNQSLPLSAIPPSVAQAQSVDPQFVNPQFSENALPVEVCLDLPDWQRPSTQTQQKHLQTIPQYGAALQSEPLLSVAKDWWSHEIFSFTTYGLSARTDPLYLSGLWTVVDQTWACYEGNQPEAINQGYLAEVWLMHHRLVGVQWQQNHYVITVEPAESGLQLVQFPRQEQGPSLPITLMTLAGDTLAVMSGDW
ncbi:MAG: hypothetical protein ACHWZW_17245 [Spirulina sp.]